jgi:hypothetical protein
VDCEVTLQNYVKSLCPYYYDVHEVFSDRASSFASYTNERNFDDDVESLDSSDDETGTNTNNETGTDTNDETGTDTNDDTGTNTNEGVKSALPSQRSLSQKTPTANSSRPIELDFTPKQSNRLSLFDASAATKKMLRSGYGSSAPQLGMAEYYQSRAYSDERRLERELKLDQEKLSLEKRKLEREEKKDLMETKRFQAEENKAIITAYSEISKLNFETMQMRKKMKEESNMNEEEINKILPLLEYPPKPSWN